VISISNSRQTARTEVLVSGIGAAPTGP
jgi:hypothetical protein